MPLERFQVNERGTIGAVHPRCWRCWCTYANARLASDRTYRDIGVGTQLSSNDTAAAQQLRSGSGGVPAGTALAKELKLLRWDGAWPARRWTRTRTSGIRYDRAGALREQLRGEIVGSGAPTRTTSTRRVCRTVVAARQARASWTCVRSWNGVRRRGGLGGGRSTSASVASREPYGIAKGLHIATDEAPEARRRSTSTPVRVRRSRRHEYRQAYPQAAVDAAQSLVVGARVSCASDRRVGGGRGSELGAASSTGGHTRRAARCRNWQVASTRRTTSDRSRRSSWRRSRGGLDRRCRRMALPEYRAHCLRQPVEPVFIVAGDGLPAVSAAGS